MKMRLQLGQSQNRKPKTIHLFCFESMERKEACTKTVPTARKVKVV